MISSKFSSNEDKIIFNFTMSSNIDISLSIWQNWGGRWERERERAKITHFTSAEFFWRYKLSVYRSTIRRFHSHFFDFENTQVTTPQSTACIIPLKQTPNDLLVSAPIHLRNPIPYTQDIENLQEKLTLWIHSTL